MARPERFELPTYGFVDHRSIQLSYGRAVWKRYELKQQKYNTPTYGLGHASGRPNSTLP